MPRKNILVRGLAAAGSLCGRISRSQDGPVWKIQRRRYPPSVRKTALVCSIALKGALAGVDDS